MTSASRVREALPGASLQMFVEQEFRDFLTRGVLRHGFARLRCGTCAFERLVPFSCKGSDAGPETPAFHLAAERPRPNRYAPRRHRSTGIPSDVDVQFTAAVHDEEAVVSREGAKACPPNERSAKAALGTRQKWGRSCPPSIFSAPRDPEARGPAAPCFHDVTRLVHDLRSRRGACEWTSIAFGD